MNVYLITGKLLVERVVKLVTAIHWAPIVLNVMSTMDNVNVYQDLAEDNVMSVCQGSTEIQKYNACNANVTI